VIVAVGVDRLAPDEWRRLRDLRLAALSDAPYAFNAPLADAEAAHEDDWRERLGDQAWFAAVRDGTDVGLVCGGQPRDGDRRVRMVRSMWVAAPERGTGTAATLLDALCDWARADGAEELALWTLHSAPRAHAFYVRYGFTEVPGVPSPHPELEMTRYELTL
jgi:GNAT superfamily N-acetyltransferase